jgi:predicted acyltransferase
MAIVAVSLLVVYWAVMTFVRAPGEPKVSIAEGHNIANWIDANYLPGRKWDNTTIKLPDGREKEVPHDPEGLLSTIPAIVSCLLGVFAGLLLKSTAVRPWRKVVILIVGGAALTALGYLWGLQFPIIKKLWTSSYVLVAGGYAAMALGVFYLLLDVKTAAWPRVPPVFVWLTRPFVWIGMNAITIYMASAIANFRGLATRIIGGEVARSLGSWADFAHAAVALGMVLWFANFLYRRKIFLRL